MSKEIIEEYGIVKRKCFGVSYWCVTKPPGGSDRQIRLDATLNWDDRMVMHILQTAMSIDSPRSK